MKESRMGFYCVSFRNATINDVIGTITLPDDKGTYYTYEVIPRAWINTHAGLTEFDLVRDDGVKRYTDTVTLPNGSEYRDGIIEIGKNHVKANWDENTNEFCLTVHMEI